MDLFASIREWQDQAEAIVPPQNAGIERAGQRLNGRAFFPVGMGLQNPGNDHWPDILVVGHNFGTSSYCRWREKKHQGSEDKQATWRNLKGLLDEIQICDSSTGPLIDRCFLTNWFVGFWPNQTNTILEDHTCTESCSPSYTNCSQRVYEEECLALLVKQVCALKPVATLLLGPEVIRRVHKMTPANFTVQNWKNIDKEKSFFQGVDAAGPIAFNAQILETHVRTHLVPLVHPSYQHLNHVHRGLPPEVKLRDEDWRTRKRRGREWELTWIRKSLE